MTELEFVRDHAQIAQELLRLRLLQGTYDRVFGRGAYQRALEELATKYKETVNQG